MASGDPPPRDVPPGRAPGRWSLAQPEGLRASRPPFVPSYQQTDLSHYVWGRLSPAQQQTALTMLQQAQRQTERRRARLRLVALSVFLVLAVVMVTVLLL